MLNRKDGPSNEVTVVNEKNLAKLSVYFWKNQLLLEVVMYGSSISCKSLDSIKVAMCDSLSDGVEDKKDTAKKSPKRTSKKPLATSQSSLKQGSQ